MTVVGMHEKLPMVTNKRERQINRKEVLRSLETSCLSNQILLFLGETFSKISFSRFCTLCTFAHHGENLHLCHRPGSYHRNALKTSCLRAHRLHDAVGVQDLELRFLQRL